MTTEAKHWEIFSSKLEECSFTCVIENALLQFRSGTYISSSEFGSRTTGRWKLQINPHSGQIHVMLICASPLDTIKAFCSVSILDARGVKRKTINLPIHCFNQSNACKTLSETFGIQYLNDSPELLTDGKLTLQCKVSKLVQLRNKFGEGTVINKPRVVIPQCTLTNQLGSLLKNDKHSDMIVAVGGQEIKAHKSILALRSPVFAAMLDSLMMESQQNRVVISDCDYEVVKEMLHYIYTGKAPNVNKMAERLLMAADKYALDTLKAICEQALCETISVRTAMHLLAVAEMYNAKQLKDISYDYIQKNLSCVMSTADYKDLITERAMQMYSYKP